jgi:hypothetical protein
VAGVEEVLVNHQVNFLELVAAGLVDILLVLLH